MRVFAVAAVVFTTLACAGQSIPSAPVSAGGTSQPPQTAVAVAATPARQDDRSDKQKALAEQAQRLVDMATELKVDVDKTNKNILSLDVVRKAEEIEALAHRMKEESKR